MARKNGSTIDFENVPLMSGKTAAKILGISERSITQIAQRGALGFTWDSSRRLYSIANLKEFVAKNPRRPVAVLPTL